ncbi:hypothetical protein QJS04_geneDACA024345 [Acorus gramineus]|uniref:Uncharacterized protein n=1 Tax=Acorus gramineus TaxID=55184 RepID=A0AAV9A0A8_ACOGR|nr:hypothetical protein QJS04_geneDACA024345 [Acorus gramineus]
MGMFASDLLLQEEAKEPLTSTRPPYHKETLQAKKKISKDKPKKKMKFSSKGEEGKTMVSDRPMWRMADKLAIYSVEELGFGKVDAGASALSKQPSRALTTKENHTIMLVISVTVKSTSKKVKHIVTNVTRLV